MQAAQTQNPNVALPGALPAAGDAASQYAANRLVAPLIRRLCSPAMRYADLSSLTVALLMTLYSTSFATTQGATSFLSMKISVRNLFLEMVLLTAWRVIFWMSGMYQPRLNRSASTFLWRVPMAAIACTATLAPLLMLAPQTLGDALRGGFLFWFAATGLMLLTRATSYTYEEHVRPAFRKRRNVLVVGTGPRARMMLLQLTDHSNYKYQLCGFVDSFPQAATAKLGSVIGGFDDLESILMRQQIDEVLIALPLKSCFSEVQNVVAVCGRAGVQTQYSLDLFTTEVAKYQAFDTSTGGRVVEMVHNDQRLLLKGAIDRTLAALGLLFLLPLFVLIAAVVKFTSKGPVFFVQERWGKNKRTFGMFKFRSMVVDAEARMAQIEHLNEMGGPMFKMKNDPRITWIGALLRRTSLDELPQLINVLKGDMSLVGPRPLPKRDVEQFSEPWTMRRFSVKPGITGLWQVSGRSNTTFDQTIRLDLRYIDHWSMVMDAKILAKTLGAVVKGSGAH